MNRTEAVTLAIRLADDADATAVVRLAALDSAAVPDGPLLLGLLDARAVVALSLETGAVVADPFTPTIDVIALVRRRAERLGDRTVTGFPRRRGGVSRPVLGRIA